MPSDIEIAQSARLQPIADVARQRLGIAEEHLVAYGRHKAKLALPFVQALHADTARPRGRLVLVTAI
ncbi:MAG: formate--tetrahydrofolate ligase, partial [Burkholderiaceae bacterium]|nr:formate--tetrahydrofolate ligase [Burkholderiaceae bacterium]